MSRDYSPDYSGGPEEAMYPAETGYYPEQTLVEESNLVDVLKYSQDDLDRFKEEAVMEENEKLANAEQEFLMEKNELQKWFESEVRIIRRNADEQITEIQKEMNLARRESASQTLKLQEEIEMKNVNIHNITQETSSLRQVNCILNTISAQKNLYKIKQWKSVRYVLMTVIDRFDCISEVQ